MNELWMIFVSLYSILVVQSYGFEHKSYENVISDDAILQINVDGTTGYLRGKQLTTIGSNKKNFFTFRNIPFAKEPERFMVQIFIKFIRIKNKLEFKEYRAKRRIM